VFNPTQEFKMKMFSHSVFVIICFVFAFSSCSKSPDNVPEEEGQLKDSAFVSPEGWIWLTETQADGKIVVAGNMFPGNPDPIILKRLSKDGEHDPSFNAHKEKWSYQEIRTLSILKGGKVLIGGRITLNGVQMPFLCFNADGSIDKSFVAPAGVNEPRSAATAADGKIFITGAFRNPNGTRKKTVIRLNADGKQEAEFPVGDDFTTVINAIPQSDGRVLVLGVFVTYPGGESNAYIARLTTNLTLDDSFKFTYGLTIKPGAPQDGLFSASIQPDGKIVVVGDFISYRHFTNLNVYYEADGILRLQSNGTIDESFRSTSTSPGTPTDVQVLDDGRVLVTRHPKLDNTGASITVYTSTGARDNSVSLTDSEGTAYGVMKQAEKTYLIWGAFPKSMKGLRRLRS
jgi:uncharacterized delta-60 repeat protein